MGNKLYFKYFAQDTTQSRNVIDIFESKQMFKRIVSFVRKMLLEKYIITWNYSIHFYRSCAFILFIFHSKEIYQTKLSEITWTLWQFILLTWKVLIYWLNLSSLSLVCGNDTGNVNDLVLLLYNEVYFLFLQRCMLVVY